MARPSISPRVSVVPADGVVVDAALKQVSAVDAIHQATCMLEHLVDGMGFGTEGKETNETFGQFCLYRQLAKQLRVAVDQLLDAPAREVDHA